MSRISKLILSGFMLSLLMVSQAYASGSSGSGCDSCKGGDVQAQQVFYPYVDCNTMSNVFAFDVSKNQNPTTHETFLSEVTAMGHTVALWNVSRDGAPPPCVRKLMIVSVRPPDNCMQNRPYTVTEAATIANWVSGGGKLMLLGEYYICSGVEEIEKAFGYTLQTEPSQITDTDDHISVIYWPIFQSDNFASHPILAKGTPCEVREVAFLATGWWTPSTNAIILSDTDGTSNVNGAAVAAAFTFGGGKVFMTGDSNWLGDYYSSSIAGMDNLKLGINSVLWLDDEPICREKEVVGGTLTSSDAVNLSLPILLAVFASVTVVVVAKRRRVTRP